MTAERQYSSTEELIINNLDIVHNIIKYQIHCNEHIQGLGLEDMTQEGYLYLCKAAATYHLNGASFPTYAKKVIYNGLLSHCKSLQRRQTIYSELTVGSDGELVNSSPAETADETAIRISTMETIALLHGFARQYNGITRKGIHALMLKINGISVTDIAGLYNVKPSYVGAWISRDVKKLRANQDFLSALS